MTDGNESLIGVAEGSEFGEAIAPPPSDATPTSGAAFAEPVGQEPGQLEPTPHLSLSQPTFDSGAESPRGDRHASSGHAQMAIKRDMMILQDHLADLEERWARLEPLLRLASLGGSGLRALGAAAKLAAALVGSVYHWRDVARRIDEARFRSERLAFDPIGQIWTRKVDPHVFVKNLRASFGLSRPTLYRVRPRQRLALANRPRVLHAIANVWVGGSTQLIVDLHDYLGHRIDMEVLTSALPSRGAHRGMTIRLAPQPASRHQVRSAFSRFRPHIAHVHYWGDVDESWYRMVFEAAAEFGCPIVQNVNTPIAPFADVHVDRNVFVSDSVLGRFGSVAPAKVIHPGVDLDRFAPPPVVDPDSFDAIGAVYRLENDKLNADAIELFIAIVEKRPKTRVIIVGDGSLFAHFRSRVAQKSLLSNFEFTGYVPYEDLPAQFARFKTFVAPVHQESFGQVIPFAMCSGLAVAGYNVGAIPEILGGSDTLGESLDETAQIVVSLLDDRERLNAIGERNRTLALARFSVERMAVDYLNIYRDLAPDDIDFLRGLPDAIHFPL
ncbi:glycosyltransferase family 4 protein [Methylocapsa aurea]|uniref:glycosyltransferase family 4 protein n=1 Tax=Methylocapsa aurea TaxID=663610 RepID=UPI00055AF960|nr:glycosyltransferase family 4 protein [Methylocapsa aurea]